MATRKDKASQTNGAPPEPRDQINTTSPLVFISHDTRDADLAEAFGNLLTDASGGVLQSFRSSDRKGTAGIEFGAEWYAAIMSKLADATDVVALLTAHSLERPWILYEAGVAKGKLDATVLGLAINIPLEKSNSGPFAQFQNCADDEDSLTKLVLQLIRRNPLASPREEAVRRQVQAFQATVKTVAEERSKAPQSVARMDENIVAKTFEEVKILIRDLPDRVSSAARESTRGRPKRGQFHPMMLDEIMHLSMRHSHGHPAAMSFLIIGSFFRDNQPWLHELGSHLYTALSTGDLRRADALRRDTIVAMDFMRHSSLGNFSNSEEEELYYFFRHLLERFDEFSAPRAAAKKRSSEASKESS